jgi:hypothetical protein
MRFILLMLMLGVGGEAAAQTACVAPETFTRLAEGDIDLNVRPNGVPPPLVQDLLPVRVGGYRDVIVYLDVDERHQSCNVVIAPRFRPDPMSPFGFTGPSWPAFPTSSSTGSVVAPGRVRVDGEEMSLRVRLLGVTSQTACGLVLHYVVAGVK